jgi:hypothetical protein
MADTVIDIPGALPSKIAPASETYFERRGTVVSAPGAAIRIDKARTHFDSRPIIGIDKLYPATPESVSDLLRAIGLLADAVEYLNRARSCVEGAPMKADQEINHLRLLLPKLFSCRQIGDGFASVINSVHFAFINLRGSVLSTPQINAIWRILRELRSKPFLSFHESLESVEQLQEVGLNIYPEVLAGLAADE